ncbi:MAG: hydrogenase nickel incorporation protein HypA [Candidatus Bathyarchaeia archaeon]|nr:hydrogenase nickel incorporation protein HypA [Candidatus Bathyarchaeota archaeon]
MHEWALAEAIISAVSQIAEREGLKEVREVGLRIGELQQVDREVLGFALSQLKSGKLSNAKFTMRTVRARFKCRVCGNKWLFREAKVSEDVKESIHFIPEVAHAYFRCPRCGSPDFDISSGRGVWISSVRGVK